MKSIECDEDKVLKNRHLEPGGEVQRFIDSECLRLSEPKVPKDIAAASQGGNLIQSGINHTKIGSGELMYWTLYGRKWYYMPAQFQGAPERGNYWFERMKSQHRVRILNGAQKIANGG